MRSCRTSRGPRAQDTQLALAFVLSAIKGGTSPSASRKPRRLIAMYSTSFGDVVGLGGSMTIDSKKL